MAAASKAVALSPEDVDSLAEQARALYLLAGQDKGKEHTARIAEALASVERGLRVNAKSGPLWMLRAVLLADQAKTAFDQNEAQRLRTESAQSLRCALAINPLLQQAYEELQ